MNITIVSSVLFISFAACIGLVIWMISRELPGWGWVLFCVMLFFVGVSIKTSDITECPKCGHTFEVEVKDQP